MTPVVTACSLFAPRLDLIGRLAAWVPRRHVHLTTYRSVQLADANGRSMGPDAATVVRYDLVAAPAPRRVFFIEPQDGATVAQTFHVVFGFEGVTMSKATENVLDSTVGQ